MSWDGVKQITNNQPIINWCDEMGIQNYIINPKGEIDVDGNVDLTNKTFEEIPYKFGKVNGYFDIGHNNNLISYKNCPDEVVDWFSSNFNRNLKSIEGCPKKVGGDFYCSYGANFSKNQIKGLCDVIGTIHISNEILTSDFSDFPINYEYIEF